MEGIDTVTSLPLTQSLLSFYREKLRDAHKSDPQTQAILDTLQPELEHVHKLERSLASSIDTIDSFERENADMKALLTELIEENAKLRLGQNLYRDQGLETQLLETLRQPRSVENHASIITTLVARCETLEDTIARAAVELSRQRQTHESCQVARYELQEQLVACEAELQSQKRKLEDLPTMQDFEFMKSEIRKLHDERIEERQNFKQTQAESEPCSHNVLSSRRYVAACNHHDSQHAASSTDEPIEQDIRRVSAKLKSLEKFALKFMPGDEVRGVPEFFETVDKTKYRIADIDERLQRRMQQRNQGQGDD